MSTKLFHWQTIDGVMRSARVPTDTIDVSIGGDCDACGEGRKRRVESVDYESRIYECQDDYGILRLHGLPKLVARILDDRMEVIDTTSGNVLPEIPLTPAAAP